VSKRNLFDPSKTIGWQQIYPEDIFVYIPCHSQPALKAHNKLSSAGWLVTFHSIQDWGCNLDLLKEPPEKQVLHCGISK
jgi:hypothetical protein